MSVNYLGTYLKTQRNRLGLDLKDVCEGTGLSLSLMEAIERGERRTSPSAFNKLVNFYKKKGLDPIKLFNKWEG